MILCPFCGGGHYVQFIAEDGASRYAKCAFCDAQGRVDMRRLRRALMRVAAWFPARRYKIRYVRHKDGRCGLERLAVAGFGQKAIPKPRIQKASASGRIPVSDRAYRKWFRTRTRRGGMDYRRLTPKGFRITLTDGKAFWNWGRRRR